MGQGAHLGSRLLLLLGSMAGAAALIFTWSTALDVIAGERAERDFASQSRAMAAARAARDALPRAMDPAERALAALQNRAVAQIRGDRREVDAIEQTLQGLTRRGQDGLRAMAVSDAGGAVTWQSQQGAVQPWLGSSEFYLAHRFGRLTPILSRVGAPGLAGVSGLVLSAPILSPGGPQGVGGFGGVALAVIDPQRLAQALPGATAQGDAQVLLFHADGTLVARGRNAANSNAAPRLDPALAPDAVAGGNAERAVTRRDPENGRPIAFATVQVPGFDLVVQSSVEEAVGGIPTSRIALVVYGLAGAITCLVALGLMWLFGRVLREAEPAAEEVDEEDEANKSEEAPAAELVTPPLRGLPAPTSLQAVNEPPAASLARNESMPLASAVIRPVQAEPPPAAPRPVEPVEGPVNMAPIPMAASGFIEALPTVAYAARITPAQNGNDRQIRITAVNSTLLQLTGWEGSAFQDVGKWQRAIDWGSYPPGAPLLERLAEPAAAGEKPTEEGQVEYRLRRPDGSWMWLRETAKVVNRFPTHVDILGCLGDVTRERELAAQADSASRVAARGAMAAGLAHELNQPLAVMSLAAENALEALEEGAAGIPEALARLRRISAQAERAKAIAAQLRSFARLEAAVLEPVSLPAAVRGALSLVGGALSEARIEVELRMAPNLATVRGQPVLVEQLVVNLALNARDAMVSRGEGQRRLTVIGEPGIEAHEVRLVIADTGGGIPAEALERVFDPFFTTKPASKGTGLGLPLCRSIMLRFGGSIGLTNMSNGQGAEAVLTFQRARQPQTDRAEIAPLVQGV